MRLQNEARALLTIEICAFDSEPIVGCSIYGQNNVCVSKKMSARARACTITGRVVLTLALPAHAHVRFIQQLCAIHKTSLNNA